MFVYKKTKRVPQEAIEKRKRVVSEQLYKELTIKKGDDSSIQPLVLSMFLELEKRAWQQKNLMLAIDTDSVGKSTMEAYEKKIELDNIENKKYGNIVNKEHLSLSTKQGLLTITALSLSKTLFRDFFPTSMDNDFMEFIEDIFRDIMFADKRSVTKRAEIKQTIFNDFKKYVTSMSSIGLFNRSADEVRNDLLVDNLKRKHLSLATYLSQTLRPGEINQYEKGLNFLRENSFIKMLSFMPGRKKRSPRIKFNNAYYNEFNKEHIYSSVRDLFSKDYPLPPKNGKPYSVLKLMEDLYAYVTGDVVQNSTSFFKYLPMEYLENVKSKRDGANGLEFLRFISSNLNNIKNIKDFKNFKIQFFQHHPNLIETVIPKKAIINGNNVICVKIPELGKGGLSEYSADSN